MVGLPSWFCQSRLFPISSFLLRLLASSCAEWMDVRLLRAVRGFPQHFCSFFGNAAGPNHVCSTLVGRMANCLKDTGCSVL